MTFEELLTQLSDDYLNPSEGPDGKKDCDRNGHTRLADLQERYNLSSLKIQKLLVTAGVYEPVKTSSSYYAVKRLYDAGKSMEEIMEETGLSKAIVNSCIPYERGAKELDKLGVEISGDAERKRKQRSLEEMKKENTRDILAKNMSEEALWNALDEHFRDTFLSTSGQRFAITVVYTSDEDGAEQGKPELAVSVIDSHIVYIPQKDVFEVFHKAVVDEKAGEIGSLGEYDEFLRPLFIFLGILEGDKSKTTTKRSVPDEKRCSCCGRSVDRLFTVSSFEDLNKLDEQFEKERREAWSDEENINAMMAEEQAYWKKKKAEQLAAARVSKAVEAFDEDGERPLCKLCCQTIYDALVNGVLPPVKRISGYDDVDDDELLAFIHEECEKAKCDYYQAGGGTLKASEFDGQSMFLYTAMDSHSVPHSFALSAQRIPYPEGDMGLGFDASEVHKLTKAGKIAADNTDTDYHIDHFKMCRKGEDLNHIALVGMVELIEKTINVIRTESLDEHHNPASNNIAINGRYYNINSLGTIIPTYVGYAENYASMKDRDWDGSEYGFMIDGKLFTGNEVALMFSSMEGSQIKFYADDPSSPALQNDESLMQVRLSQEDLVNEVIDLINMFTKDGAFEREKDRENFKRLFEKYLLEKFRLYHESRPRGYGRLAGMEMIKKLRLIEGTEECQDMIRGILGK